MLKEKLKRPEKSCRLKIPVSEAIPRGKTMDERAMN
jgi:hypothetical protein